MKKLTSLLLTLFAFTATAMAAQDTVKIFLWNNDAGETAQEAPAAAMDKNSNSCYVWADKRDGDWNIYGRLWGRKPEALSNSFMVNQEDKVLRDQKAPDVAGKTGEFVFVVWQDSVSKEPYWQIYGRKMRPNGEPMSDQFLINRVVVRNAKFPKIAINPKTQEFVVVWQDDRNGDWDIYARLFDSDCNPKSDDELISDDTDGKHQVLPVVSSSEKGIAVAWMDYRLSTKPNIFFRYFKPDLSPVDKGFIVNDEGEVGINHYTPAIAASDTGYFTIAWIDCRQNAYGDICAQRYDLDSKPIGNNFKVNLTTSGYPCRIPSITMGIDNVSFWVSWADSTSADRYQIKARYFDYLARWESVKLVNENPANGQRAPSVCRFGEYFSVAWLDSSRTAGLGDIFGQYFTNSTKDEKDSLKTVGVNYNLNSDPAAGRKIWYHPKKNYDNPATPGWNEDPIAEPESLYIPLDSAYVRALAERNIPNQNFFQITDTEILEYAWRKQGKVNSTDYDMVLLDLGYAEDGSSAGVIQAEQLDSLEDFAVDTSKCLLVTGNDFGEMYNTTTLFSYFGSKYVGPGNSSDIGNIQQIGGVTGTFTEGMLFDYPYQQGPDNSVDVIDAMASGSGLIMGSDDPKSKWSYGRATSYSDYYKGSKASTHKNIYLTFSIGSLSNGVYPSTASELTRRILAYQGFNVEPEPIIDLVDSVYTSSIEGTVELSWTAVSDDNATEKASKYWLKYTKYNASAPDLGKMSAEEDFIDTGMTYYQAWTPANVDVLEKKTVYGFAPGDTLIFALKAGDESSPVRWSTLGNEPRIVASGDTVTPHTVRLGYTYGGVNDFCKSERIGIRNGDTLFTTWDATSLYLGYNSRDWRTQGDMFIYFDTRTGGADSTCAYNVGDSCSGFDPAFRPDFCLIIENGTTAILKKATGSKTWVDSIASYSTTYLSLDSINKYNYLEVQIPFAYLKYTVGNVFKYLVVCNNETNEHSWSAYPTTNNIGKGAKAPVAKYPYFYQINSLTSGISPRTAAQPLAVELSEFACQSGSDGITLTWQTASENNNYEWLIERSSNPDGDFQNIATIKAEAGSPSARQYSYTDAAVLPNSTYYYRLGDMDLSGQITWHGPVMVVSGGLVYDKLQLMPCRPNPASGAVNISFILPKPGKVSLTVYDICGRRVNILEQGVKNSGAYSLTWKGDDSQGRMLPAGVYFYQLNFEGTSLTQRIVLLR